MSDVVTTIREYLWVGALISLVLSTLSAWYGSGWGKRGALWTIALGRRRGLAYLKERRAWVQQLHDSDRAYYGWLLRAVLWVLALLGFHLGLEGFMTPRPTWSLYRQDVQNISLTIVRFVVGIVIYTIAMNRLLDDRMLRRSFDCTVGKLDRAIATLEAKLAAQETIVVSDQAHVRVDLRSRQS
jgi:hypothetical protein